MAAQPQTHRSTWTDERLDDLAASKRDGFARVDGRFDQVDLQYRDLKHEMDRRFDKVDERFDKIDARFDKVDERFGEMNDRFSKLQVDVHLQVANLNRTMITGLFVIIGAMIGLRFF